MYIVRLTYFYDQHFISAPDHNSLLPTRNSLEFRINCQELLWEGENHERKIFGDLATKIITGFLDILWMKGVPKNTA